MKAIPYTTLYVLLVFVLFVSSFFLPEGGGSAELKLTDPGKSTLEYLSEMSKLIGTLNTAMFAACGSLAIKGRDWSLHWGRTEGYSIVLALVAGAACYYGTYLADTAILEMVNMSTVDPFSTRLQAALYIQYYGLLLGAFFLGLVFVRMMEFRKEPVETVPR